MKAAINGVPSLSILDGWWIEGCVDGVTGWSFGDASPAKPGDVKRFHEDAAALFGKLDEVVAPTYYRNRDAWVRIMSHAIALNGSHFNTQRMVQQYVLKAYYKS